MPRSTPLVHPERLNHIDNDSNVFNSLCTLQEKTGIRNSLGEKASEWTDIVLFGTLECQLSVVSNQRQIGERELGMLTYTILNHFILFKEYIPEIEENYRAVVDGQPYDIVAVEHDSQKTFTRLRAQVVEA